MAYPKIPNLRQLVELLACYASLKHENGSQGIQNILDDVAKDLQAATRKLTSLKEDAALRAAEPDDLAGIRALRPAGPRKLWQSFRPSEYRERLAGALLARMAGCTLGAPVEAWSIQDMAALAKENREPFPPTNYWKAAPYPWHKRYTVSEVREYTLGGMKGVPVDDDVEYTLLGLLIAEDYGLDFTTADVGAGWKKYLPIACTAEDVALRNLKKGISADKVGEVDNPFCQWIGADIRSDPWAYMAPAQPELAAELAYRDAYISHRRNGIYGEMFFSAAISAAFAVDDPMQALEIGLTEIPRNCSLTKAIKWALKAAPKIKDYQQARAEVDKKFAGMHTVHTTNNACLTIFGLAIGGKDVTKVISQTVAMGLDNDCTAATAGSIVGACVGKASVPSYWYKPFGDTIHTYLTKRPRFSIRDVLTRFTRLAKESFSTK